MSPDEQFKAMMPSGVSWPPIAIESTPYEPTDFAREFLCVLVGPEIAPGSKSRGGSQNPAHLPADAPKTPQRRYASRCKGVSDHSEAAKRTRYVTRDTESGHFGPVTAPGSKGGAR